MKFVKPEIFTFGKQFKCKREIQPEMDLPPVDLYLISEKSIWKNQVGQTDFLVYFKLDFYCLCGLQKSILKSAKNRVRSKIKYRSTRGYTETKTFEICMQAIIKQKKTLKNAYLGTYIIYFCVPISLLF